MPAFTDIEDGDWVFRVEKKKKKKTVQFEGKCFFFIWRKFVDKRNQGNRKSLETLGLLMNFDTITLKG